MGVAFHLLELLPGPGQADLELRPRRAVGLFGFFKAVADGQVNTMFDYQFAYKMNPVNVRIHMKSANSAQGIWVFIKQL